MNSIDFVWYHEGEEVSHSFPSVMEVCDRCEGHGTHLNPNIGNHAYSQEEFYESFDEEDREQYFTRGGIYDVSCEVCKGNRVVPIVDEARLNEADKLLFEQYEKYQDQVARDEAEDQATYRMESGGWDY